MGELKIIIQLMATENQYQLAIVNAATGTTVVVSTGNVRVHSINFPKATSGIVKVANGDGSTRIDFPAASIGSMILDAIFPVGLSVNAASAESFTVTYAQD